MIVHHPIDTIDLAQPSWSQTTCFYAAPMLLVSYLSMPLWDSSVCNLEFLQQASHKQQGPASVGRGASVLEVNIKRSELSKDSVLDREGDRSDRTFMNEACNKCIQMWQATKQFPRSYVESHVRWVQALCLTPGRATCGRDNIDTLTQKERERVALPFRLHFCEVKL